MTRIMYLGLFVLPVFFWHVSKNVAISTVPILSRNTQMALLEKSEIKKTQLTPFLISARDDKIQDCLRFGNCKD